MALFLLVGCTSVSKKELVLYWQSMTNSELKLVNTLLKNDHFLHEVIESGDFDIPKNVKIAWYDVDSDGEDELFLYMESGVTCWKAGCSIEIWKKRHGLWENIGQATAFNEGTAKGVAILPTIDNGFHEIRTGGKVLRWDGRTYR
jgi:hypothetical protein